MSVRQREEENEENRLSEEAERTFERSRDGEDEAVAVGDQSDDPRGTITVPAIVTAT